MDNPQTIRELTLGETIGGKYRIVQLLGAGGMGAVYAAERLTLGDQVAIKCILGHRNTAENRDRFLREARAAARIRHHNVVRVFDFGELDDQCTPYMVMELLQGPTLAERLAATGPLSAEEALSILAPVCAAIEAGHRRGVVHRDIKPGNVIIDRSDDGQQTVKVLDFGLAVLMEQADPGGSGAMLVGTVDYMPPEQLGGLPISPASDVFSLGVLLYEMVTGKLPFRGTTAAATMFNISQGEHEPVLAAAPQTPGALAEAIEAAISVAPSDRPRSPLALAKAAGAQLLGISNVALSDPVGGSTPNAAPPTHTQTSSDATAASSSTNDMVGRAAQCSAVHQEFDTVAAGVEGRCAKFVLLTGDVGVGKTRLLSELSRALEAKHATVVRGRFHAYGGDRAPPHQAFAWMVDDLKHASTPHQDKWATFEATAEALAARAKESTLVVVVDDLQWAAALDLEFLSYLMHGRTVPKVFILATAGQDLDPDLERFVTRHTTTRELRRVPLAALTADQTETWLQRRYDPLHIRSQDARRIQHVTSGNPLALVELARQLTETGRLTRSADGWECHDLFDVGLPDSISALVQARLSGLAPELVRVLEVACVIGEAFRFETLLAAMPALTEEQLEAQLDVATHRRLLTEEDSANSDYQFTSSALRKVLYDGLRTRDRKRLHRRVVEALTTVYAKQPPHLTVVLAYHHDAIGDPGPALEHALRAAQRSIELHDTDASRTALEYANRALGQLVQDDSPPAAQDLARFEYVTGVVNSRLGHFERAAEALGRAVQIATSADDPSAALDAMHALAECRRGLGDNAAGVRDGERAIEMARALSDLRREYLARVLVAGCLGPLGKIQEALELVAPVIDSTEPQFSVARALALRERAWMLAKSGEFAKAQVAARGALAEATAGHDAMARYQAVSALGLVHAEAHDYADAIVQLRKAMELARALSLRRREAIERSNIGECMYLSGDVEAGLAATQAALPIFIEIADVMSEGDCRVNIGRMLRKLGRIEEAAAMLDLGREACAKSGRAEYEGIALCELAELRATSRDPMLARALFEQAVQRFESIGAAHLWRPLFGLARMNAGLGDLARSQQQTALALGLVRRQLEVTPKGFDTTALRKAAAEITAFDPSALDTLDVDPTSVPQAEQATLTAQHRELEGVAMALLRRRSAQDVADQADGVANDLTRFDRLLRAHSNTESLGLYPYLLQHDDQDVRRRASALYSEGLGMYDDFFAFRRRYADAASLRADSEGAFGELTRVLARLGRRMHREEQELHPMAMDASADNTTGG